MNTDRRVRRTRRALHDALLTLMTEKSFDAVTVQDIIDRADVGRSTFYSHFTDKRDLLDSGFEDLNPAARSTSCSLSQRLGAGRACSASACLCCNTPTPTDDSREPSSPVEERARSRTDSIRSSPARSASWLRSTKELYGLTISRSTTSPEPCKLSSRAGSRPHPTRLHNRLTPRSTSSSTPDFAWRSTSTGS